MDQVFDFREFLVTLLKKCRLALVLLAIFGILGAAFGFWRGGREAYISTSSAAVTLAKRSLDPSALTSSVKDVNDFANTDFFYNSVRPNLKETLGMEAYLRLFPQGKEPSLSKFKEIIKFYTKGNFLFVDVTAGTEELAAKTSQAAMQYAVDEISGSNDNVTLTHHSQLSVNINEQNGGSRIMEALKFGALGLAGGFALGILWIFFADVFSLKVNGAEDLRKYQLPLLGDLSPGKKDA